MDREALREVIGKRRSIEVLELLATEGTLNYSEIVERVPTSSDIVSDRLQTLGEYGLIERTEHSSRDVRYSITQRGETLLTDLEDISGLLSEDGQN